jgi:hypothetical protein
MDIRPFDDLPPGGLDLDPLPRGIAQVEKDGRARRITTHADKIGFGPTGDVGAGGQCADGRRQRCRRWQTPGRLVIAARQPANDIGRFEIVALLMPIKGDRHRVPPIGPAERAGTRGELQQFLSCACFFAVTTRRVRGSARFFPAQWVFCCFGRGAYRRFRSLIGAARIYGRIS